MSYSSSEDTLSTALHFIRRHLVCGSTFLPFRRHIVYSSTFLPWTPYPQYCMSSEDTLSTALNFSRRHFVCSSACLHGIWSGVQHFFRRHLVYCASFLLVDGTLSTALHFFRRQLVCSSTFLPNTRCLQFCMSTWHLV